MKFHRKTTHQTPNPTTVPMTASTSTSTATATTLVLLDPTSHDGESLAAAWGRESARVEDEVLRLAADAAAAGLHGVVCSGGEAKAVSEVYGDRLALLVPGIRLVGEEPHDQRRVVTPHAAQRAGARYVVLGRTVTAAADPRNAFRKVLVDLAQDTMDGMPAVG